MAILLVMITLAVAVTVVSAVTASNQESRLLRERAAEVGLVLSSAVAQIPATFAAQGAVLRASGGSVTAYRQEAALDAATGTRTTYAWLRPLPGADRFRVLAVVGSAFTEGQTVTGTRAFALTAAERGGQLLSTPVFGSDRELGFAMGPPSAPAGTVLYRESALGALSAPRESGTAPFAELDVVIYASPTPQQAQVVTSTTNRLPLTGQVHSVALPVGSSRWTVAVRARHPLIGSLPAAAPWLVGFVGALGAVLVAALVEVAGRRRDAALALYVSEHHVAETLQRSLLPDLPRIAGVDLAARYLAAGHGQEVGGDWFDVFPLAGGRVGVAIGDVMGHDLAAAAAMSQIRSALRAYAVDGDDPGPVLERLDRLVDTFSITPLVTVVYGVLGAADTDGRRLLRYANAGHLPPLLRGPDGDVNAIEGGASVVIGAGEAYHAQAERVLEPASTLLLFTDGLVEVRGESLEGHLKSLSVILAALPARADADAICESVLTTVAHGPRSDDIAILAIQVG